MNDRARLASTVSGAIYGGAIGDALGWPMEMGGQAGLTSVSDLVAWRRGALHMPAGSVSDDTQLTLALARALRADGSVDMEYFAKVELVRWLEYQQGGGRASLAAARGIASGNPWWWNRFLTRAPGGAGRDHRQAGGNGVAMRIAPLALVHTGDAAALAHQVMRSAVVTHSHPRAIFGALIQAEALRLVVMGVPGDSVLVERLLPVISTAAVPREDPDLARWAEHWDAGAIDPLDRVWDACRREALETVRLAATATEVPLERIFADLGVRTTSLRGSGTHTAAAALAIFLRMGRGFRQTVLTAANSRGADTDTIAAMAGALSGAAVGIDGIPVEWRIRVANSDYLGTVADALTDISRRAVRSNPLRPSEKADEDY